MLDALVSAIIGIEKPGLKAFWDLADRETVVLSGDIAALRVLHETWLVLAAVPEFHLIGISTCCQRQQLIAHADTKGGNVVVQCSPNGLDRASCHFRITGT